MQKKFCHICEEFQYTWIGKDNGLIPIYMKEIFNYDSEIVVYDKKKDLPPQERGVKFIKLKEILGFVGNFAYFMKLLKRLNILLYLKKNALNIDILMLFHVSRCSYWNAFIYKKYNPKGKVYIKADFNLDVYRKEINRLESKTKNLRCYLKRQRTKYEYEKRKKLIRLVELISYESKEAFEVMKDNYCGISTKGKTMYLPNGYDNLFIQNNIKIKKYYEKENIILSVGRLGTEEKNTEFLLESLKDVDLKNWKVILIGEIEKSFEAKIEEFYQKNLNLKEKIKFIGKITNKKELYEYYNKSKIFLLPSKWESFGIVMVEAMALGNYILTSNTCAAKDITNDNKIGEILSIENPKIWTEKLNFLLKNEKILEEKYEKILEYSQNFKMENLIKKLNKKLEV